MKRTIEVYKFPTPKHTKVQVTVHKEWAGLRETKNPDPQPIQGRQPDSKEEYYVALALYKLNVNFIYRYEIYGGRNLAGGLEVDFLAFTVPGVTPIMVHGDYWHRNKNREDMRLARIRDFFRGQANDVVVLWTADLTDIDEAYKTVKQELNL